MFKVVLEKAEGPEIKLPSLDVVCVREEMGGGGSRTLLSVLEFVTIPRGEVSKFENCVAKYPIRTLLSPLFATC